MMKLFLMLITFSSAYAFAGSFDGNYVCGKTPVSVEGSNALSDGGEYFAEVAPTAESGLYEVALYTKAGRPAQQGFCQKTKHGLHPKRETKRSCADGCYHSVDCQTTCMSEYFVCIHGQPWSRGSEEHRQYCVPGAYPQLRDLIPRI